MARTEAHRFYFEATKAGKRKEYDRALALCAKAKALDGRWPEPYYIEGVTFGALRRHREAIASLSTAIQLWKTDLNPNVYVIRALSYQQLGDYGSAWFDTEKARSLGHKVPEYLVTRLGHTRTEAAAKCLRKGLELLAGPSEQPKLAFSNLTAATQLDPQNAAAWFFLGVCHNALRKPNEAISSFNKAIIRGYSRLEVCKVRVFSYLCAKRPHQAMDDIREWMDSEPGVPKAYAARGLVHRALALKLWKQPSSGTAMVFTEKGFQGFTKQGLTEDDWAKNGKAIQYMKEAIKDYEKADSLDGDADGWKRNVLEIKRALKRMELVIQEGQGKTVQR